MRPTSSLSCGSFGLTARYCDGEFLCCAVGKFCQVCCALLFMDCSPEVRALEGWSHRSCLRRKLKVLPNIQTRLSCWFELGDVWATVWHSYSLFHPPYGVVFRCEELSHTHTHRCELAILNKECFPSKSILFPELTRYWRTLCTYIAVLCLYQVSRLFLQCLLASGHVRCLKTSSTRLKDAQVKMMAGLKLLTSKSI